ncbi:MAG TPA: sensor domain-containing diguanylate cyclase, partial [Xanthomonadales bacterium]|nr:sensor domain-containing diguanylate cyclase [Xanthomonadales bacterium]
MSLLVTDKSPEVAEHINSLLRNSGIKIHVIHVARAVEVKRALEQVPPILLIYAKPESAAASIEEISSLADEYSVPFAFYSDFQNPQELIEVLRSTSCLVIHSESETQLTETVSRMISRHELNFSQARQRSQMDELEHRYDLLLESARDAMAYIHEGLHVYANRAYLEALHVKTLPEIAGISLLDLMKAEGLNLKKIFQSLSRGEFPQEALEVKITRPDKTSFEASLSFSPARYNGEACTQMLVHQRDAAAGLAVELERMRITDPVTQLRNKRYFAEALETELTQPRTVASVSAILLVEPDGMSDLIEVLDAANLDTFVADLARVLGSCLGEHDVAARVSDHGFAVLTRQTGMEKVEELCGRILKTYCGHLVEFEDRSISVSCSIGIATLGRLAHNSAEVLAGARKALAEAAE